jgi:hypothetical protein
MKTCRVDCLAVAAGMLLCLCASSPARALTIQFRCDYDTAGFFNPAVNPYAAQARATLENAGRNYEMFTDSLPAIAPGGDNTWSANFTNPATGSGALLSGLVVPADTMIVFVGGRDMGSLFLGSAGPGGFSAGGSDEWLALVESRGQAGALLTPPRDFGPWGGSISFNIAADWNYDPASGPGNGDQHDFFSVCLHELAHVLGFGSCESWDNLVDSSNDNFIGSASEAVYGGPVPLSGDAHWEYGTQGLSGGQAQEAAMSPALTAGTRKRLTTLDLAGLVDVGWQMPTKGDANLDGVVNGADYMILKRNIGGLATATWTDGDFDFDGAVTGRDLGTLGANFGAVFPTGPAQLPEPLTAALLAAGGLAVLRRNR